MTMVSSFDRKATDQEIINMRMSSLFIKAFHKLLPGFGNVIKHQLLGPVGVAVNNSLEDVLMFFDGFEPAGIIGKSKVAIPYDRFP